MIKLERRAVEVLDCLPLVGARKQELEGHLVGAAGVVG